jgi:hypothetical protein
MQLIIEKSSLAGDIKKAFTTGFPFLRIEFYKKQTGINNQIKKEPVSFYLPIVHTAHINEEKKIIHINKQTTVEQLENEFASLGITAEIFRTSGNVLVETSLTRNWTLEQQNKEAMEISSHFTQQKNILPNDF